MTATISDPEATLATRAAQHNGDTVDLVGVTPELRALLTRYTEELDNINKAPVFTGIKSNCPWVPRALASPALRYFTSALFVRYLYRSADALKSGVMGRIVSGTADEHSGDLKMLDKFEESLPSRLRLAFVLPMVSMVVLSVAYLLAWLCNAGYRNLFGDLATAAITVNRTAAIAAFSDAYRLATCQHPLEAYFFAGAALIVALSAIVAIVPLLPAFYFVRRARGKLAEAEARAFDAVDARPAHDIELDLFLRLLLIPTVALLAVAALTQAATQPSATKPAIAASVAIGVISAALTVLAGIELGARYRERHNRTPGCRSLATKVSFAMVAALSAGLFVALPVWERYHNREFIVWPRQVATKTPVAKPGKEDDGARGWLTDQLSFLVTKIEQNAPCSEPHSRLIEDAQYLRFDLEVWSNVDEFANTVTAHALALPHWSVRDSQGKSTGNLYMHAKCGHGTDAIAEPIVPGSHTSTAVVVSAPKGAACLQLDVPSYHGVWTWPILPLPPAKECKAN
jgi:hypothetical protein